MCNYNMYVTEYVCVKHECGVCVLPPHSPFILYPLPHHLNKSIDPLKQPRKLHTPETGGRARRVMCEGGGGWGE